MNRKIMASLLVIGVVGALAGGSTFALFNDTETSDTNTFTAGALDLQIDWIESYNGEIVEEQELTDNPGSIFDISDVKPGDRGEANVSLHVFNNPAHVWMNVTQTANRENGCTEPEAEVDDSCGNPGDGEGELGENLYFTVYDQDDELIFNGTAEELDGTSEYLGEFQNSTTEYVKVKWWVPREVGNVIQTDSKHFRFDFYAEQSRHNPVNGDNGDNGEIPNETEENVTPVNWQVDLAQGEVIESYNDSDETYTSRGDMERFAHGLTNASGPQEVGDTGNPELADCIDSSESFSYSGDGEDPEVATEVVIEDRDACDETNVTLVAYENTGDLGWSGGVNQIVHDFTTVELDAGEEMDLSADLPPAQVE